MKSTGACLVFLLFTHTAFPCIWITGTKFSGESISASGLTGARLLRNQLQKDRKPDGAHMEASLRGATNFNDRSDYAVALIYLGRSPEAVDLLQQLENEQPGQYFIAANLGTAFELVGNNEEALRWINEGIRRNPDSHEGTEWLHTKVLASKIAQQKDPDHFKKHSVLELHPEQIGEAVEIAGRKLTGKQVKKAIEHQLTERLQFVKPPDPAVASLLFDYAAIEAGSATLESAKLILAMATEYGFPSDKVQPLLTLYDRRIAWRLTKQYALYTLIGVGLVALFCFFYKKRILVLSRRDLERER